MKWKERGRVVQEMGHETSIEEEDRDGDREV